MVRVVRKNRVDLDNPLRLYPRHRMTKAEMFHALLPKPGSHRLLASTHLKPEVRVFAPHQALRALSGAAHTEQSGGIVPPNAPSWSTLGYYQATKFVQAERKDVDHRDFDVHTQSNVGSCSYRSVPYSLSQTMKSQLICQILANCGRLLQMRNRLLSYCYQLF